MNDAATQTFPRGNGEYRRGTDSLIDSIHRVTSDAQAEQTKPAGEAPTIEQVKQRLKLVLPGHTWFNPVNQATPGVAVGKLLSTIFGVDNVEQLGAGFSALWSTPDGAWCIDVVSCICPQPGKVNVQLSGYGDYKRNSWTGKHSTIDAILDALVVHEAITREQANAPGQPDTQTSGESQLPGDGSADIGAGA